MRASYRWQSFALGSIAGFIYVLSIYSWKWSHWNYVLKNEADKFEREGLSPPFLFAPLEVFWLPPVTITLFGIVSVFVNKYRSKLPQSLVLLWQLIGVTTIAITNMLQLFAAWIDVQISGNTFIYKEIFSPFYTDVGITSFIIAIVTSALFGIILSIATKTKILSHRSP